MNLVLDGCTPVADVMYRVGAGVSGAFVRSALLRGANYVAGAAVDGGLEVRSVDRPSLVNGSNLHEQM